MIDPEIEKINSSDKVKTLNAKVMKLEEKIKTAVNIVSTVGISAGILGISAWSSISAKIDELNKNAEKVENRYCELNKQIISAEQRNITLNTHFVEFSTLISQKNEEQLQRFNELNKISSKALLDSERAMTNAGMLLDAVKAAQASADRSEATNKQIDEQMGKIESYMKSIRESFMAIQKTQNNLEAYIAKNIKKIHSVDKFKISVSSHYGTYIIIEGDGIPYDKQYSGYEVTGYIIIPPNCNAIIDDSGYENTFWVSDKVKTRTDISGTGRYRKVRSGECTFK